MGCQGSETWDERQDRIKQNALDRPVDGEQIQGQAYLADRSYYYFNSDKSVYCRNAPPSPAPATPTNFGSSLYISPAKSLHYTPSSKKQEQTGGKYFIGYDYRTVERLYYWDNGEGIIVRTLKKNLDFSAPLEQHDVRTYTNKDGIERVIIVDDDWNYVGQDKVIMEELEHLPAEEPVVLSMTHSQESAIVDVDVGPEVTIKTEGPVDVPMALGQVGEIGDGVSNTGVTIKIENPLVLVTPLYPLISASAVEETEGEEVNEEMLENARDGTDNVQISVVNLPTIDTTPTISMSKIDSRPRNTGITRSVAAGSKSKKYVRPRITRITRSATASSFAFRVTRATARKSRK
ncbi:hypothetical protein N431DRAFT_545595 [Stipitochalara longipes BDJ]|nr:hypothetical protein N431DRAFT_545595 [Stipitochalara longipes BDJ]